ncbi:MAG TPA: glycosyltransferase family 2 protein [Bacteroidales bacterium]|nr:glycosyltransferase family 2 protein [Bacteroidales bacterium]
MAMLSLVIPIFNEEQIIDELLTRTVKAVESITADYEIIFVDDGSTDNSSEQILNYRKKNSRIKLLSLSRNFGHQAAYTAGLEYSKGDIIAMLDGDLQDPPELLPEMYRKITEEDYDIVSGKRSGRKGHLGRNLSSTVFHLIFKNIGDIKNMENYGNYSVMKRIAVEALLSMKEKVRYLPGLRTVIGFKQGFVEYIRDERFEGKPKMTFRKLFTLASDAIFSFSRFPIALCLILGTVGTAVFMGAGLYVIIAKISGTAVPGWSSTLLSLYFLGSIQLVFLGIIGEYIFRNYKESQNRPVYFVRKFYDDTDTN